MSRPRALTPKDERRIQRLVRLRKQLTNAALARRYNVSASLISDVAGGDFRTKKKLARAGFGPTSNKDGVRSDE